MCHHFSVLDTSPLIIQARPPLKDSVANVRIFRNKAFFKLKIAKESNDLVKVLLDLESKQKSNGPSMNRKR